MPEEIVTGPVPPAERIETLDILRGFAIFAILIVNWTTDLLWDVEPAAGWAGLADKATFWLVWLLLDEKSWPIFAFLFGLGFAIQMERLEAKGVSIGKVYSRRLLVLFVIGAAHFILTERDILFMYAILGFLLLPMRKWSGRALLLTALICVLVPWTRNTVEGWQQQRRLENPETAAQVTRELAQQRAENVSRWAEHDRIEATGSFGQIVSIRAQVWFEQVSSWKSYIGWLGDPFPPFLLGLYIGRRRILHRVAAHRHLIRRLMVWSLAIGLIGLAAVTFLLLGGYPMFRERFVMEPGFLSRQLLRLLERFGSPALGLFYIGAIALVLQRPTWQRRLRLLAPVGRMALTNYLLHSVVFVLLFFGYGLRFYGQVGTFGGLLLTFPVIIGEIYLSRWWLQRFRFGPVEWLWRTLTYGKLQPMRLSPAAP
ncbi:MAG: DUF418 domain-containing protein [Acidobacteria bacterium]|nr:DUF418 domain-containing protein [Acidobacteriota bacterium]